MLNCPKHFWGTINRWFALLEQYRALALMGRPHGLMAVVKGRFWPKAPFRIGPLWNPMQPLEDQTDFGTWE